MHTISRGVSALAICLLFAFRSGNDPLPIGSPLPRADKKMKDVTGNEVSFSQAIRKNGLMVMFSCNTCPVVKKYQTRTNEVCQYALAKDIGVVLLNSNEAQRSEGDGIDDMKDYARENGYDWYYLLDQNAEMADLFGAMRTPEVFLFDASGRLVYQGAIDDNANGGDEVTRKHLTIAIDELLAGKDIARKTTRSVGCSIKRP